MALSRKERRKLDKEAPDMRLMHVFDVMAVDKKAGEELAVLNGFAERRGPKSKSKIKVNTLLQNTSNIPDGPGAGPLRFGNSMGKTYELE